MRPAQLALLQREIVVGGEAIAHDNAAKAIPKQLDRSGSWRLRLCMNTVTEVGDFYWTVPAPDIVNSRREE